MHNNLRKIKIISIPTIILIVVAFAFFFWNKDFIPYFFLCDKKFIT